MKYLTKGINIFVIMVFISVSFMCPVYNVKAKTIGEMKRELDAKLAEYEKTKQQKELSEQQREQIQKDIEANENRIVELIEENAKLDEEIAELNKSIESKYQEIKRIINTNQIMNGESNYLEYIFGASSFTDFIYRASVAEQLSKYNKKLMDDMSEQVKIRETKQEEIKKKQDEISKLQEKLREQYEQLGQKVSSLVSEMDSEQNSIKLLKDNIAELQNTYKCSDDEDIEECKERARRSSYIPASTGAFIRPINHAIVTGNYGYYVVSGVRRWHTGMDLAASNGAYIYPAAPGRVVAVFHQTCGNWMVYIVHNVNGTRYTTGYFHMRQANVKVNDLVSTSTVIGIQGGGRWEDTCSTGYHLHFVITLGAYKTDYFNAPTSVSVNPRNYVSFPPLIEWYAGSGTGYSAQWDER